MNPCLLLANTTVTGGDTGAHVALAAFLKTNLLPHLPRDAVGTRAPTTGSR